MYNSAKDLAHSIREGNVSVSDAVRSCLKRIERYNQSINAIVTLNKEAALSIAKTADTQVDGKYDLPSLFGVPITIKDAFETEGIITTSSYKPLKDYRPTTDATVVARLKEAGAIVVGKTNLPELAADFQCWSPLFGRTNNPWDPTRTSGGSSGGSAAAVAMNFSYLDIGSDLAGSIRIPAAYCGVAGLKATENRVPRTGHIPHLPGAKRTVRRLLSIGVLARCVNDLRLGFDVIAGEDVSDAEVPPVKLVRQANMSPRPLRIAWWDDFAGLPVCNSTRIGFDNAVQRLSDAGMTVEHSCPEDFDFEKAWYAFGVIMGTEAGADMPFLERLPLSLFGRFAPKSMPLVRSLSKGLSFSWRRYNDALNMRENLIDHLEKFLSSRDVWLCPVTPSVAVPHRRTRKFGVPPTIVVDDLTLPYLEGSISMTAPFSLTGSPVVAMPVGIVEGLPVGIQVIGKRWRDETLLDNCLIIESLISGYQAPPAFE